MLQYKINLPEKLKETGYSTYRLRKEKLMSESTVQKLRDGSTSLTLDSLDTICTILQCQPGDILEWVPDDSASEPPAQQSETAGRTRG